MLDLLGEVEMMETGSDEPQVVERGLWMCIGDAYVHGIMDGEAWPDRDVDPDVTDSLFIT